MSKPVVDKGRKGKHLNIEERRQIAALYKEGYTPYKIGKILGRSEGTIRNELRRGTVTILVANGAFEKEQYFPDTGQLKYEENRKRCREPLKVKQCAAFIEYVEYEVLENKRSFDAIHGDVLKRGIFSKEEVVCVSTLYSYTDRGILNVRNIDLPEKVSRKVKKTPVVRKHKRLRGTSIEERPKEVDGKEDFGHWEIDLVVGKRSGDNVLLTLTERKSKKEIIRKIKDKTTGSVMGELYKLEKEIPHFDKIFKTITTDNGVEFSKLYELEDGRSVRVYYAHPYSSWERPLNESTNRIIRRFIGKGKAIRKYSKVKVQEIEDWINTLPRKILGYATAEEVYRKEVEKLLEEKKILTA